MVLIVKEENKARKDDKTWVLRKCYFTKKGNQGRSIKARFYNTDLRKVKRVIIVIFFGVSILDRGNRECKSPGGGEWPMPDSETAWRHCV